MKLRLLAVLAVFIHPLFAQGIAQQQGSPPVAVIPFQDVAGHIYIDAKSGKSADLSVVVDSGAPSFVMSQRFFERSRAVATGSLRMVPGYGESQPISIPITSSPFISLGGIAFKGLRSLVYPMDSFSSLVGHKTDAVIGSDLFSRYVVAVDYQARVLRIYDPTDYRAPSGECTVPLHVRGYPLVNARVLASDGKSVPATLALDTGSNVSVFTAAFSNSFPDLPSGGKTVQAPKRRIVSGITSFRAGRVRAIEVGRCTVHDPTIAFSQDTSGIGAGSRLFSGTMGTNILSDFTTIFDYRSGFVVFIRHAAASRPDEYDMTGLHVLASGPGFHTFTIDQVMPKSPAKRSGVTPGDQIESVNHVPASRLTMDDLYRLFRKPGLLHLRVRRGQKRVNVVLRLKPLV